MEKVCRLTPVKKIDPPTSGVVSGGESQVQIDAKMEALDEEFQILFQGIGKAKIDPIHIYTKKGRKLVAQ